jgi:hypothetical protein
MQTAATMTAPGGPKRLERVFHDNAEAKNKAQQRATSKACHFFGFANLWILVNIHRNSLHELSDYIQPATPP